MEKLELYMKYFNDSSTTNIGKPSAVTLRIEHRRFYEALFDPDRSRYVYYETGNLVCEHVSVSPLSTLKRIGISEIPSLLTATVGRYLLLRTLEKPIFMMGIKTVVEDHTGQVCNFTVFSFFSSTSEMRPEDAFPVGTIFILKEPVMRHTEAGCVIHCDCPTNMIILGKQHKYYHLAKDVAWKNNLCDTDEERDPTSVEGWKETGNKYFKRNMLPKALEAYFMALKLTEDDDIAIKDILNSNISATYLKLGYFESTLLYAKYVLERDPRNLKANYRSGRAHYELRQYNDSFQAFKRALEADPNNEDVKKELERSALRLEEEKGNISIINLHLASELKPQTLIDCADYTGPLKVVPIPGKGRGMVATEDIKPGTLLFVAKALHVTFDSKDLGPVLFL